MAVSLEMLEVIRRANECIEIRMATRDDAAAFTEFLNANYRRQKTEAYFHWQFFDAPHPAILAVAYDAGKMVGCFGVMVRALNSGDRCGFLLDLLVAKSHRSRGLHIVLAERLREFTDYHGAVAVTSLSNTLGQKAISGLNGWKVAGVVRTLVWRPDAQSTQAVTAQSTISARHTTFARPRGYMEWRFEKNPLHNYQEHREPSGVFAITKSFTDPTSGEKYLDIVDYDGSDPEKLERLVNRILRSASNTGESTVWALPGTPARRVFDRCGFRESTQERFFCVGDLKPGFFHLGDIRSWHLVEADSEVF